MKTYLKASIIALLVAVVGVTIAARNGSGTYTLPAGNPVNTGTAISSTWANNTLSDIATALSDSIAKDGQTTPTANLPMGGFKHTSVADASARNQYASAGQIQDGSLVGLGSVGGTDAITGTLSPAITAYSAGMIIALTPTNTNTGATTLAVNGLTALDVQKYDGDALVAGDLVSGVPAFLILDAGADDWILLNPQSALQLANGGTGATTASAARTNLGATSTGDALFIAASAAAARSTLGVSATGADTTYAFRANNLSDLASAASARTNLGLGSLATASSINGGNWSGTDLAVVDGGTGASDAATARSNLGVPSTGGSGASGTWGISISGNAATATSATTATTATSATSASSATTAGSISGQGNLATLNANQAETRNITGKSGTTKTLSSSGPSGGSDGDIWYRY